DDDLDDDDLDHDALDTSRSSVAAPTPDTAAAQTTPRAAAAVPPSVAAAARATAAAARATADDVSADDELAAAEAAEQQLSSPALILFGLIGGVFFLYTIGWFVSLLRSVPDSTSLAGIVQIVLTVLAIAAPVLWFAVTLFVAYRRRVSVRIAWLLVGVVVLIPWPFVSGR
ncbi:hypothetical protein, partial [Subtercola sp. YIM 133946]|uniref:hypothetical protein n=1 Tax=Subtercola sp. YIM 133946 TaxID=3118909 RepID=UPI002F93DAF0